MLPNLVLVCVQFYRHVQRGISHLHSAKSIEKFHLTKTSHIITIVVGDREGGEGSGRPVM